MLRRNQRINGTPNSDWLSYYMSLRNSPDLFVYNGVRKAEKRFALFGLIFSLMIVLNKILYTNRYLLYNFIFEKRLISYESITTDGEVMLKYAWTSALKYSRYWFPAVCGVLLTWFTWLMVYLDSNVPGVKPPSPFSPTKYKLQSGHTFHLNYIFAVVVGVLVYIYMVMNGISL